MYNREKIEEALEALSLGFSSSQAAELVGVAPSTVEHWSKGRLPLSWDARGARIAVTGHRGEAPRMTETRAPYDPPASGPLAGLSPDQIENLLLRAVLDDPGFDVEQEQVRARREIEAGDGPAPPLRHRFLENLEELL